jgi:hypothetical protein
VIKKVINASIEGEAKVFKLLIMRANELPYVGAYL